MWKDMFAVGKISLDRLGLEVQELGTPLHDGCFHNYISKMSKVNNITKYIVIDKHYYNQTLVLKQEGHLMLKPLSDQSRLEMW